MVWANASTRRGRLAFLLVLRVFYVFYASHVRRRGGFAVRPGVFEFLSCRQRMAFLTLPLLLSAWLSAFCCRF
ncbi:hypothetical protein LMG27177_00394 [Paraburkholderia fynbosensis]|uniref:Uncharacterized protein n=2 Tax=Paraburkholderia fynbosensis TaxID=1200993 RepID=A0A6J5FDK8_9BURK|nr:hypothetical protein LMG27177_00394 [Paraburkholderia fynbosensis]